MATILIVDDRQDGRLYLVTVLKQGGHQAMEAHDGLNALAVMDTQLPELVITDILMPRMDGFEFVRRMRQRPDTRNIPVILYTGAYDEGSTRDLLSQCAGVTILPKPADAESILRIVDQILADAPRQLSQVGESFSKTHLELLTTQLHGKVEDLERANADLVERGKSLTETVSRLRSALGERTVLLKEVHHRVKNNLAVISGFLNMQADTARNRHAKRALERSHRRIRSMAMVHEHLYGSDNLDRVNFSEYIQHLTDELLRAFVKKDLVNVRLETESIELGVDQAIPCGLILNELLANTFKYGFPEGERGEVLIGFGWEKPESLFLTVHDNGAGTARSMASGNRKSLGLQIVRILTQQLGGTLDIQRSSGSRFELKFPAGQRQAIP